MPCTRGPPADLGPARVCTSAYAQERSESYLAQHLRAPSDAFELKVGTGYTQGFGNIAPGRAMGDVAGAGIGVSVDVDYRLSRPAKSATARPHHAKSTPVSPSAIRCHVSIVWSERLRVSISRMAAPVISATAAMAVEMMEMGRPSSCWNAWVSRTSPCAGRPRCYRTWRQLAPRLASDRRVLMPDLPGHGLSGRPEASYELRWYADVMSPPAT
jgi:hypothetical protein